MSHWPGVLLAVIGVLLLVALAGSGVAAWVLHDTAKQIPADYVAQHEIVKKLNLHRVCLSMDQSPQSWPGLESPCDEDDESLRIEIEDEESAINDWSRVIADEEKLLQSRRASRMWGIPRAISNLL